MQDNQHDREPMATGHETSMRDYTYDYELAVYRDILTYMVAHIRLEDFADHKDAFSRLVRVLGTEQTITGHVIGYTQNVRLTEARLCHNRDLLAEAVREDVNGNIDPDRVLADSIYADMVIRKHVLKGALESVLRDIEEMCGRPAFHVGVEE